MFPLLIGGILPIELLIEFFNAPLEISFIAVEFVYFTLSIFLLGLIARECGASLRPVKILMTAYTLLFPNLFIFHSPIYTYDEPVLYLSIFLCFYFYLKRLFYLVPIATTVALFAKENVTILFPGASLFFLFTEPFKHAFFKIFGFMVVPLGVFVLYLLSLDVIDSTEHSKLLWENFRSSRMIVTWVGGFFMVMGVPISVIFYKRYRDNLSLKERSLINCFLFTVFLNLVIVGSVAKAKETRLFVLPLMLILPFGALALKSFFQEFHLWFKENIYLNRWLFLKLLLGSFLLYHIYFPIWSSFTLGFRLYFIAYSVFVFYVLKFFKQIGAFRKH